MIHPLAITMWDFSWIERRWDGAGFEDWNAALDGVKERGYDAVRIDAFPHLLSQAPEKEWLLPTYVMDGEILYENLLHSGKDEEWLKKQLSSHGCKRLSDVFLATGNQQNTLNVYLKNNRSGSSVIKE